MKIVYIITRSPEVAWLFGLKGNKVVYYAHNFPESKKWLARFFLSGVNGIIANSNGTAEEFKKNGFKKIEVVRNGVDLSDFLNIKKDKLELRRELSLLPLD